MNKQKLSEKKMLSVKFYRNLKKKLFYGIYFNKFHTLQSQEILNRPVFVLDILKILKITKNSEKILNITEQILKILNRF
jgi:hypothetical protein